MSAMSVKRKRVVVTIKDKLEAIRQVENGVLLRNVAANYGLGISTVSEWVKSKSKLHEYSCKVPNRKTMKLANHEKINEALYLWFTQQRDKGMPLSGVILQEKAKLLAEIIRILIITFCGAVK